MDCDNEYGITVLHPPNEPCWVEVPSQSSPPLPPIVFDLVAIHGLNGHAFNTWTHKQSKVMWLRDLLPQLVPNIRIMTYGYNAKFRNFTGHQDLRNITSKLLAELVDLRRSQEEALRPLVFVCHSLGGIVAKKALTMHCPEEQKTVQDACYGIMFMGTPHNGSSMANLGKVLANIISACTPISPATSLLKTLRPDSKALFEISEDFVREAPRLKLVSFFEMEMMNAGFRKKLIVDHRSAILNLPNEVPIGQNADHRNIVRFRSENDRNLRPVVSRLQKFKRDIENSGRSSSFSEISVQVTPLEGITTVIDLPFAPTKSFHGREEYLRHMEQYFFDGPNDATQQLTYAICGLGGSGKTQTALQFAARNRDRYKSGVIFINASSHTTLMSDFDRVFELLRLSGGANKVLAVTRWLSDSEHKQWLLIFDNADDLASICLSKYFPSTTWGHIIITSRDQSAISIAGSQGASMEPLEVPEAMKLLLNKAKVQVTTQAMEDDARAIVEALGCLPLALDQAASYILTRKKTLADYRRLYNTRQQDLLSFCPRLSVYDKSVLTAWELNFAQVEKESPEAAHLLMLFCFLDASAISDHMLLRGCSAQNRWGEDGEIEEVAPEAEGVDPYIVSLIQDEVRYDCAIEKLLSFSLIQKNNDYNEVRSVSLHPLVQYSASMRLNQPDQNKWRAQAILLVCHAFPRNQYIEDTFGDTGRPQLPHLARALIEYDKMSTDMPVPTILKQQLVPCLLAASRFLDRAWKQACIERAKSLMNEFVDRFLSALVAQRETAIVRLCGSREASQKILEDFIHKAVLHETVEGSYRDDCNGAGSRWNAQRGELVVAYAENLIQEDELEAAERELRAWEPLNQGSPAMMECLVMRSRNSNLGRILRDRGEFEESLYYFESLHRDSLLDLHYDHTGHRRIILSNMADLYCELGRASEVPELLRPELEHIGGTKYPNTNSARRLQICLAEAYICLGQREEARTTLCSVRDVLEALTEPDMLARTALFRVWYGLARLAHTNADFAEARACWAKAITAGKDCKWSADYPMNVLRYSLAHALFELGDFAEAAENLESAVASLRTEGTKFWTVGVCTYWYKDVQERIRVFQAGLTQAVSAKLF